MIAPYWFVIERDDENNFCVVNGELFTLYPEALALYDECWREGKDRWYFIKKIYLDNFNGK